LFNDARRISDEIASNGEGGGKVWGPIRADIPFIFLQEMGNPTKSSRPKSWTSLTQHDRNRHARYEGVQSS
jgi:hypothetical protein